MAYNDYIATNSKEGLPMLKKKDKPGSFGQLRKEWLPDGASDGINYCMPVNIGVIAQQYPEADTNTIALNAAIDSIMAGLAKCFGAFCAKPATQSHNQLVVMCDKSNPLVRRIAAKLETDYGAEVVSATVEEIKSYCWITLAAWDGLIPDSGSSDGIFRTVTDILSAGPEQNDGTPRNASPKNYQLVFPDNRPVFQIVLPSGDQTDTAIDYTVREIYPHPLEIIAKNRAWFTRHAYPAAPAKKDPRRRNFQANARKIREFNKQIIRRSKTFMGVSKIDRQKKNVYDLLPWHHYTEKLTGQKILPDYVDITNLRQIYYDVISMEAQQSHNRQAFIVLLLTCCGLGCFSLYSDLVPWKPLIYAFVALMLAAYLFLLLRVKSSNRQKQYLEFRALAEGMRVQCYWYAAGINESAGTHYTVKFQKEMTWAKQAFHAWYLTDFAKRQQAGQQDYQPDDLMVKTEWLGTAMEKQQGTNVYQPKWPDTLPDDQNLKKALGGQFGFFGRRINDHDSDARNLDHIKKGCLVLWLIIAAVLLTVVALGSPLENPFICIMGLINILTLAVTYFAELKAYRELVAKYSYCVLLAQKAIQDYDSDPSLAKEIFKAFGQEALEENAEWLMIQNDRQIEVPNN